MPEDILPKLDKFLREAERVLTRSAASSFFEELMELYFSILSFTRIAELYDAHYTTYAEKQQKEVYVRLYNVDPSKNIRDALRRGHVKDEMS